jgi:hypothetical protein
MSGEAVSTAPIEALWREVTSIGGENGYYYLDALWKARGCVDELTGGTGLSAGAGLRMTSRSGMRSISGEWSRSNRAGVSR